MKSGVYQIVNEEISPTPCSNCEGQVIEFSIPNDIWNKIIRPNGEHDNEYLCWDCFWEKVRRFIG